MLLIKKKQDDGLPGTVEHTVTDHMMWFWSQNLQHQQTGSRNLCRMKKVKRCKRTVGEAQAQAS